ncbi:MAG: VCBS repeat-containing protein, partial [Cytophagales bacterium]|nr:VCBS repeat-containing protein [Cytophagales bacterium]
MKQFLVVLSFLLVSSCSRKEKPILFTSLPASLTGIDFQNQLTFDRDFNIYTYRNFFNGGGVAAGDINNDGLFDLFFTSNQASNRLYLNLGEFKFKDITDSAGIGGMRSWSTGVSMA